MSTSRVRVLSEQILRKPLYLEIDREKRISEVAFLLKDFPLEVPRWNWKGFYPQSEDFEEMCLFYLIFNSINYCYFDEMGNRFTDGKLSGSSLAGARLVEKWDEIKDPIFLAQVDENYLLTELFAAEIPISLVKQRTDALREVGRFLNQNLDFTFEKFFRKYKQDAYFASQVLPTLLPSWRDPFFKRSQLFVGMSYSRFFDLPTLPIKAESIPNLTIFADYKIPQTLISMRVILPKVELWDSLLQKQLIPSGSKMELELRAASVVASDLLLADLKRYRKDETLSSLHTDYLLWACTKSPEKLPSGIIKGEICPHHLTMTTDY